MVVDKRHPAKEFLQLLQVSFYLPRLLPQARISRCTPTITEAEEGGECVVPLGCCRPAVFCAFSDVNFCTKQAAGTMVPSCSSVG